MSYGVIMLNGYTDLQAAWIIGTFAFCVVGILVLMAIHAINPSRDTTNSQEQSRTGLASGFRKSE